MGKTSKRKVSDVRKGGKDSGIRYLVVAKKGKIERVESLLTLPEVLQPWDFNPSIAFTFFHCYPRDSFLPASIMPCFHPPAALLSRGNVSIWYPLPDDFSLIYIYIERR
jgi:hypothetical protein